MPVKPRAEVERLAAVIHGSLNYKELEDLGIRPEDVLDFSDSANPYGPSESVRRALAQVALDCYPDRESLALRRVLSDHLQIEVESILVGNGSAELLWLIGLAYVRPNDWTVVIGPMSGEYTNVVRMMGGQVAICAAGAENNFEIDLRQVESCLARQPRLAFLGNPNNPVGRILPLALLIPWIEHHPHTLFIVDEAYMNFSLSQETVLSCGLPNLIVLRSMTKDYALAGLRLGFAVGGPDVIQALERVRPPWNVNALAQAAGVAAVEDQAHLNYCRLRLLQDKALLVRGLQTLNYELVDSQVHYFLLRVGDGAAFRLRLLQQGLQVRDCASFGLPHFVRVAVRKPEENSRLLNTLAALKGPVLPQSAVG